MEDTGGAGAGAAVLVEAVFAPTEAGLFWASSDTGWACFGLLSQPLPCWLPRSSQESEQRSMSSPSPTWTLCSFRTTSAVSLTSLSITCAARLSPLPTRLTVSAPPKVAKTRRTCKSVQLDGKPRTKMRAGKSSSPSPEAFLAFMGPFVLSTFDTFFASFLSLASFLASLSFRFSSFFSSSLRRTRRCSLTSPPPAPRLAFAGSAAAAASGSCLGSLMPAAMARARTSASANAATTASASRRRKSSGT